MSQVRRRDEGGNTALILAASGTANGLCESQKLRDWLTELTPHSSLPSAEESVVDASSTIQLLLSHGASVTRYNDDFDLPLHAAAALGCFTTCKLLLQNESQVNAPLIRRCLYHTVCSILFAQFSLSSAVFLSLFTVSWPFHCILDTASLSLDGCL